MCFIQLSFNLYFKLAEHHSCKTPKISVSWFITKENKIHVGQSFKLSRGCGSHVSLIFRNSCFWTSEISGIETRHKMDEKRKKEKKKQNAREHIGMLQLCRLESSSVEWRELLRGGRDVQNHLKTVLAAWDVRNIVTANIRINLFFFVTFLQTECNCTSYR